MAHDQTGTHGVPNHPYPDDCTVGIDLAKPGSDRTAFLIVESGRPDGVIAVPNGMDPASFMAGIRAAELQVTDLGITVEEAPTEDASRASVTRAGIEAKIVKEDYLTGVGDRLTICVLTLANGFIVTGESACVDPANFDAALGRKIAREVALEKIWPLEGYLLREQMMLGEDIEPEAPEAPGHDYPTSCASQMAVPFEPMSSDYTIAFGAYVAHHVRNTVAGMTFEGKQADGLNHAVALARESFDAIWNEGRIAGEPPCASQTGERTMTREDFEAEANPILYTLDRGDLRAVIRRNGISIEGECQDWGRDIRAALMNEAARLLPMLLQADHVVRK